MNGMSLRVILEAESAESGIKNASGEIKDLDVLLSEKTLRAFEKKYGGPYIFLAFDHRIDCAVTEYVRSGTLTADSGDLLVLFPSEGRVFGPRSIRSIVPEQAIRLQEEECVIRQLLGELFPTVPGVVLPGILFFHRLVDFQEPVFVQLQGLSAQEVAARLRSSFAIATEMRGKRIDQKFEQDFSFRLEKAHIPHKTMAGPSLREYLLKFWRFVREKPLDIVSIIK